MLVRERMTANPVVVHPETSFQDALQLLREKKIRRLPVVDKHGDLVGIVVEKDLLFASPSPATTLNVYEVHYLLSKLAIQDVMTKQVFTVGEDCPLEEAARIMIDHKIGSLPIVEGKRLKGIITETDVFKVMAEALGGRAKGLRIVMRVPEVKGELAQLTARIAELGGNIVSLAVFQNSDAQHREITLKVQEVAREAVLAALEKTGAEIMDVREIASEYKPKMV
ncbi:MAG: CBS domain-containing protein [Acidobacteria bacterium]|nr:CBS domain-containing protein [Acidobacteriota bacterium]